MEGLLEKGRQRREEAEDGVIRLAANAPLTLRGREEIWQVEAGAVEVFAVPNGAPGPRIHLLTVPAGGIVCGLGEAGGEALGLLAVGAPGTRLFPISSGLLGRLDSAERELLAPRVDGWISGLASGLGLPPAPRSCAELRPQSEGVLEAPGRAARSVSGVVWIRRMEGDASVLGDPAWALPQGVFEPLPEAMWVVAESEARLEVRSTLEMLLDEGVGTALAGFQNKILARVEERRSRGAELERERAALRQERDRTMLGEAYARLGSVLVSPKARAEPPVAAEALLAACQRVGSVLGIEVRDRPEGESATRQGDRLAQICAASRIRSRRVLLRDDWWRRDNGPLVAFVAPSEDPRVRQPVALIPSSVRGYDLIQATGERSPLDASLAERLTGEAYMLYPSLPARPVTLSDLVRLAFAGRRRDLGTLLATGAAGGLLGLLVPILTGQLFGSAIPGADRAQLAAIVLALLISAGAAALFQLVRSLAVLRIGGKLDGAVQAAIWDRLPALPVTFFRRYTVGDLADRAMGIDTLRGLLTGNVLTLALAGIFSVFSFSLLFHYSVRLAWLATGMVALLIVVTAALVWAQLRHQRAILAVQGKIASLLFGLIHGIAKLRVAGAEPRAFARWAERFSEQRRRTFAAQRMANVQATFNALYGVMTSLGIFAMAGFSSSRALPMGEFLAFNAAFGQFLTSGLALVSVFSSVLAAVPLYERLRPILEAVPEMDDSKAEPGELRGDVEFSHVSFRYGSDGPVVLDDVSFRAREGEFIALVGPSGAGKSTCLRLLLGFERPTSGSIYFDAQDLAGLAAQSVRRQLGVVLQSGRPMAGSLFSNIVGSALLGIDEAWEAARAAGLEEDIKAMPMGMHTVVSEGAETFSGGQKQRILIARAIVQRPRILLFDEATSALDNRTQEIVSRSLEGLKATRIVIAHRLSTILNADRIYVIEGGKVVEEGTYGELIGRAGPFAKLAERQIA